MKTHGLSVRRGEITTLCNGRPNMNHSGEEKNIYTGDVEVLYDAIKRTREKQGSKGTLLRVMIPKEMLGKDVTCHKCRCLMHPRTRTMYMKKIYEKSWRWKERKTTRPRNTYRMEILGSNYKIREERKPTVPPVEEIKKTMNCPPGSVVIPPGRSLVLTFSVI